MQNVNKLKKIHISSIEISHNFGICNLFPVSQSYIISQHRHVSVSAILPEMYLLNKFSDNQIDNVRNSYTITRDLIDIIIAMDNYCKYQDMRICIDESSLSNGAFRALSFL